MRKLIDWLEKWVPRHAMLPIVACFLLNCVVYVGAKALTAEAYHYDLSLPLDHQLPYVPFFVVIYVLAYVSWAVGFVLVARERPEDCEPLFGEMISKLFCFVIFVLLPTTLERPADTGSGFFGWGVSVIYFFDPPTALFPSIHCIENWIAWRGLFGRKTVGRGVKAAFLIMALLVFLSTLLVKQHVLVDIPAAIAVSEAGMLISRKLRLGQRYAAYWRSREVRA